jgi:hypothetical protein
MRNSRSTNSPNPPTHLFRRHTDKTLLAHHVSVHYPSTLHTDTNTSIQSYWAFTATTVLLFTATTKLTEGQPDTVSQDLLYAKACLDMLEICRSFEPIAARYLDTLWPLYDSLRAIHQRMVGRAKTSIYSLLQTDPNRLSPPIAVKKEEMGPIAETLSGLLADPFGRKCGGLSGKSRRRVLDSEGSFAVFWWD